MKRVIAIVVAMTLGVGLLSAQNLEERLQTMAANNAKAYLNPFVTAFGTAMNSGWYFTAKPHKLLGFDIGVRAMAVEIPKAQQTFNFDVSALDLSETITIGANTYTVHLDPETIYPDRKVPTAFGSKEGGYIPAISDDEIVTEFENQLLTQGVSQTILDQPTVQNNLYSIANNIPDLETPPGFDLAYFAIALPQASLGISLPMLPIHLELSGRYLPEVKISDEIGKFKFVGVGGKLALDPFIPLPLFGIKIAAGAYMQKLEVGKIIESNHALYSLQVSRDFNLLLLGFGLYGGIGKETSDFKVKYTYNNTGNPHDPLNGTQINFDLKGENDFRTTLGVRVRLAFLNINADISNGTDKVATAGVSLTLR